MRSNVQVMWAGFTSLGIEPSTLATPADSSAVMCSGGGRGILTTSKRLPLASVWLSRYCSASTETAYWDTRRHRSRRTQEVAYKIFPAILLQAEKAYRPCSVLACCPATSRVTHLAGESVLSKEAQRTLCFTVPLSSARGTQRPKKPGVHPQQSDIAVVQSYFGARMAPVDPGCCLSRPGAPLQVGQSRQSCPHAHWCHRP